MPIAPWQEHQLRVVVEFKKSNKNIGRVIELTHTPDVLPPQLQGRVHPETWRAFMIDVQALAKSHPYTARQNVGQCCWNLQGLCCFVCIGFGIFEPDGGSYRQWQGETATVLAKYQPTFGQGGCQLVLQEVHGSHYISITIDPNVAVGVAVGPPGAQGPYESTKPPVGAASASPGYYPPQQQQPQPAAVLYAPPAADAYGQTAAAPPPGGYPATAAPPPGAYGQTGGAPPPGGYPATAAPSPGGYPAAAAAPPGAYGQPAAAPPPSGYPAAAAAPPSDYPAVPQYPPMK